MYAGMLFALAEAAGGALASASFDTDVLVFQAEEISITYIKPATTDITIEVSLPTEAITSLACKAQTTSKIPLELACRLLDTEDELVAMTANKYSLMRADRVEPKQIIRQEPTRSYSAANAREQKTTDTSSCPPLQRAGLKHDRVEPGYAQLTMPIDSNHQQTG